MACMAKHTCTSESELPPVKRVQRLEGSARRKLCLQQVSPPHRTAMRQVKDSPATGREVCCPAQHENSKAEGCFAPGPGIPSSSPSTAAVAIAIDSANVCLLRGVPNYIRKPHDVNKNLNKRNYATNLDLDGTGVTCSFAAFGSSCTPVIV